VPPGQIYRLFPLLKNWAPSQKNPDKCGMMKAAENIP